MPRVKLRRLHVWESPALHPNIKKPHPVHVVFNDQEYDWWRIGPNGNLEVGWTIERPSLENDQPVTVEYHVFYAVASGMFAKVNEEWYTEEPEDDRGSAALGRARNEEADDPHVATAKLPARSRFKSFEIEGHPPTLSEGEVETEQHHDEETVMMPRVESDHKIVMDTTQTRVDPETGVNIGMIHDTVNSTRPVSPAQIMLLGPIAEVKDRRDSHMDLVATRVDLHLPIR